MQSGLWSCKQDTLLRNVHISMTCIRTRNIFQDLVNRLKRSGLRQWVAGVFVRAWESREVEAWTGHDKGKYSFKSITADKTEFQSTQRCHVKPWDLRQRCSLSSWIWKRWHGAYPFQVSILWTERWQVKAHGGAFCLQNLLIGSKCLCKSWLLWKELWERISRTT